ncbi:hypothetical protein BYT27DRAFT_7120329 [Phlegmacium glaucopus]|nr:hypothetical protein BYT27DRAFT_7120329 [Phlegmacium glaucopus]
MEEADAITLLLKASCLDAAEHVEVARMIVTELGCIPLAVNHAGAYIEAGNCDINRYLKHFSLHHQTLMSDATFRGASDYDQTVYGTWDLSFKEIEIQELSSLALTLAFSSSSASLLLFWMGPSSSPLVGTLRSSMLGLSDRRWRPGTMVGIGVVTSRERARSGGATEMPLTTSVPRVLLSFSLMKRGKTSEMLSVHPLVHCWSRERMIKCEQERICEMGSIILSCAIPWRFTSQDYALRRMIFPHIKVNGLHGTQIGLIEYYDDKWSNFALVMRENGDWKNLEQLEEQLKLQVMDMRKKVLGAEHPDTLMSMGNLANTYCDQGRWSEAEQLVVQVMDMRKKVLGADHPHTLRSMQNLAYIYHNQGRWNDAEYLELEVTNIRRSLVAETP